jgi:endonuclease YncB( thermonuclease family)
MLKSLRTNKKSDLRPKLVNAVICSIRNLPFFHGTSVFSFSLSECPLIFTAAQVRDIRVTDAHTIKVRDTAGEMAIRLVGIDAPEISHRKYEIGQAFRQQAKKNLAGLVLNKTVDLKQYGHDRYEKVLGVVFLDGKSINLEMVKAGYAEGYRGKPAPGLDLAPYWNAEEEERQRIETCEFRVQST